MNVRFYFEFEVDGREFYFSECFNDFDMHIPRIGDHIYPIDISQLEVEVVDVEDESDSMVELPSYVFLVYKVVHNLNEKIVFVFCEAVE